MKTRILSHWIYLINKAKYDLWELEDMLGLSSAVIKFVTDIVLTSSQKEELLDKLIKENKNLLTFRREDGWLKIEMKSSMLMSPL